GNSPLVPPRPFSALIFDCDGTLADTLPLHYQAWAETVRRFGGHLPETWYFQRAGVSTVDLIHKINQDFGYNLPTKPVERAKRQRFSELLSEVQPNDPVTKVVAAYAGQVPMAVASGGARQNVERTLAAIGLAKTFQSIVTIEAVGQGKPAPDLFLLAAQQLNCSPEGCIVYEDSDVGIQAAVAANMRWINVAGLGAWHRLAMA
ncbi:MAG: HAD family phosphatase, partial [Leptolyngbyaceae cyanobacterium SM2_5_2]|nr:HAD family phosphatase [Leptolyngbyaceae cyanobacterium SM2_5_2]